MKQMYYYSVFNILCIYAMSVNDITNLAVSVLAFQQIFHFVHQYWCW